MAKEMNRGEIWMLQLPAPNKRRPVLVLSRQVLLEVLNTATVAAISTTMRGSPYEVALGPDEGLKKSSTVNLVNVFTVPQADLHAFVGSVPREKMTAVCHALSLAVGCD